MTPELPGQETLASWERRIRLWTQGIPYTASADPQYWGVYDRLQPYLDDPRAPGLHADRLLTITVKATLSILDNSVNSVGFVCAWLTFAHNTNPSGTFLAATQTPPAPYLIGGANVIAYKGESYDPQPLPVGGVNYPIWTTTVSELQLDYHFRHDRNPGELWWIAWVQVNGSLDVNPAAELELQWHRDKPNPGAL